MPTKRTPRNGGNLNERVDSIERQLANDRLDRIERAIERSNAANDEFRALVRGAFTMQQDQITELRRTVEQSLTSGKPTSAPSTRPSKSGTPRETTNSR